MRNKHDYTKLSIQGTSVMMLTISSSDVGAIKQPNLGVPKIKGDSWPYVANFS